jgi:hypothetical protein
MNPMKLDPVMMLRAGPGTLPTWSRWTIGIASIITVVAIALGGSLLTGELAWEQHTSFWLGRGVAEVAGIAIVCCFVPPAKLSRFLRLAVLLPVIHGCLLVFGWEVWASAASHLSTHSDGQALAAWFPFWQTTALTFMVVVAISVLVARRREWLQALTTLTLSTLLLVGLWMPMVAAMTGNDGWWIGSSRLLPHPLRAAFFVAVPPLVAASVFTFVSLRRPIESAKTVVLVLLAVAILCRIDTSAAAMVVYANFVPILLVAVLLAVGSLVVFAIVTMARSIAARRRFVARERMVGVVDRADAGPVIALEIASWLRAPRVVQRSFSIATSAGAIPVSGAELVAPLPAATTLLSRGETLGIIHGGDAVVVAGHARDSGNPFRSSAAPLSGELWIAPADVERAGLTSMTLAMWRPAVAYLLIVTAVALPGLAALLS